MIDQQRVIEAMASDLKRVALGFHRHSYKMAAQFFQEALQRKNEIVLSHLPNYVASILQKIECIRLENNPDRIAEDCLMYSTLLQNFAKR